MFEHFGFRVVEKARIPKSDVINREGKPISLYHYSYTFKSKIFAGLKIIKQLVSFPIKSPKNEIATYNEEKIKKKKFVVKFSVRLLN